MDLSKLNKQAVKTTTPSTKLGVQAGSMKVKTGIKAGISYIPGPSREYDKLP
jgi:hypothetical protein